MQGTAKAKLLFRKACFEISCVKRDLKKVKRGKKEMYEKSRAEKKHAGALIRCFFFPLFFKRGNRKERINAYEVCPFLFPPPPSFSCQGAAEQQQW